MQEPSEFDEPRPEDLRIAGALAERGYAIAPDFASAAEVAGLAAELAQARARGAFRRAGIGRGESFRIAPEIRQDEVLWLEPSLAAGAERAFFARMEELRRTLNQTLQLGLFEYEAHYAVYPPGAFYRAHVDRFAASAERVVTTTLYLNEGWRAEDGGTLRLYLERDPAGPTLDVPPLGGTLAVFLTQDLLHEVLPTRRERRSIAGWFRRR